MSASIPKQSATAVNKAASTAPGVLDKENVTPSTVSTTKTAPNQAAAAASATTVRDYASFATMPNAQLKEELRKRGLPHSGNKDKMLERLGVPAAQWRKWRAMKVSELKEEVRKRGMMVTGSKHELLESLGVPTGFGETSSEKVNREIREIQQKRKAMAKQLLQQKKQKMIRPEDDPTHENYTKKCCDSPHFPAWNDPTEPAGMIRFPDGSVTEVWRCLACGKIPEHPNAPPVQEFSDSEDDHGAGFTA